MPDDAADPGSPAPTYAQIAAMPTWRRWALAVTGARIPVAMAPLALVYLGHAATGSFAVGSLMAGAYSIAEATCAPGSGRLLARSTDIRRALRWLLIAGAGCLLALGALAWLQAPTVALIAINAACGGVPAAAQGGLRAMLHQLVPHRLREKAFVLDATLLEIQYAAGPAIVAACLALGLPVATSIVMAAATLICAALISTLPTMPPGEGSPAAPKPHRAAAVEAEPAWRARAALGTYAASLMLGYAEGSLIVALPALLGHIDSSANLAGLILVALSLSSAAGGWTYGLLTPRLGAPPPPRAPHCSWPGSACCCCPSRQPQRCGWSSPAWPPSASWCPHQRGAQPAAGTHPARAPARRRLLHPLRHQRTRLRHQRPGLSRPAAPGWTARPPARSSSHHPDRRPHRPGPDQTPSPDRSRRHVRPGQQTAQAEPPMPP